jgi:hypothetical protein
LGVAAAVLAVLAALGAVAAAAQHHARPAAGAALSPEFGWWTEPGEFRVAVPAGWPHRRDQNGALVFDAPAGGPTLRVSRWAAANGPGLASARPNSVEARPGLTFQGPGDGELRGVRQVRTAGGRTYLIEWQGPRASWAAELPRLTVVLDSFGPDPAG